MNSLYASEELVNKYGEIGFQRTYYNQNHLSDLQQWMLYTHGLWVEVYRFFDSGDSKWIFLFYVETIAAGDFNLLDTKHENPSSALSAGLLKAYEIIKQRQSEVNK